MSSTTAAAIFILSLVAMLALVHRPLGDYMYNEMRFKLLTQTRPAEAERLLALAQSDVAERWKTYERMAA